MNVLQLLHILVQYVILAEQAGNPVQWTGNALEKGLSAPLMERLWELRNHHSPTYVQPLSYHVMHLVLKSIEVRAPLLSQVNTVTPPEKERRIMKQKMKTHKAMAKRVKVTGSGKFMRRKVALNHLRRNKSPEAVRSMDKKFELATADTRRLKRLLPYSF